MDSTNSTNGGAAEKPIADLIAEHALMRLIARGWRGKLTKLPRAELRRVAERLMQPSVTKAEVGKRLGLAAGDSAFYRFAAELERAAVEVHHEMIAGILGPRLFTPAEAARRLRVSSAELLALVDAGELAAVQVGRHVRLSRAAIDAFLEAHPVLDKAGRYVAK